MKSPDGEIRTRLATGDSSALDMIWTHYASDMFGYLVTLLCSRHDAEDTLQDVFVTIARKREAVARARHLKARQSWMGVSLYLLIGPLSRFGHAAHIALTDGMAREMLEPYPVEGAAAIQQIQEDLPWYCVITKILAPEFRTIRARQLESVAQIRVTRAGLAVLRQHDEQGEWPEVLPAELADLTDPFTGKPLIYQPSSTGFVLYSVGKNLTDDKGTAGESGEGDIVWRHLAK